MRIKNKLHYILKYLVLSLPILIIILSILVKDLNIYTSVNSSLTIFNDFLIDNSAWYSSILNIFGVTINDVDTLTNTLLYYPVYIFYIYLFDLVVDTLCFVPRFIHDFIYRYK